MNQKKIKDFEKGDKIEGYLLVRNADKKISTNGKDYLDMILADDTG